MIRRTVSFLMLVALALMVPCLAPAQPNLLPLQNGFLAVTCFSGDYNGPNPNGPVVGIIDVSNPTAPLNTNWMPPMYHGEYAPAKWTASKMGEVFGICFDAAGNIYVTATTVYGAYPFGPGGGGGVYRIDGVTGAITTFASLPNAVDPTHLTQPGLGNISHDPTNNQFFVTNFEDGKIYRLNSAGTTLSTFDPFTADGGSPGFAPRGERLWGIRVYGNRVYYSVWWEDGGSPIPGQANQIWSVGLNGSGDFVPTDNTKEIDLPIRSGDYSQPVSDIAFSTDGTRMLMAERTMYGNIQVYLGSWAHDSRVLEATGTHLAWTMSPVTKFKVGVISDSNNCAGGVDYAYHRLTKQAQPACDSVAWSTGDAIHFGTPDIIYGLQGFPWTGGTVVNCALIDADGITNTTDKTQIGDVRVFKNCKVAEPGDPCDSIRFLAQPIQGGAGIPDRSCCWKIRVQNLYRPGYFFSIQAQVITPGVTFASSSAPTGWTNNQLNSTTTTWQPSGGLPLGASDSLIFCLDIGNTSTQQVVVCAIAENGVRCCDTLTLDCKPPVIVPPCVSIVEPRIECKEAGPNGTWSYSVSFFVKNNSIYPMTGVNIGTLGGFSITPNTFTFSPALAANGGTSSMLSAVITGAPNGGKICFEVTLHDNGYHHCCTDTICVQLPKCQSCCDGFRIAQGQFGIKYDNYGKVVLGTQLTAGPMPITAVSATIVSATIKQKCIGVKPVGSVFGDITAANAIAGLPGPSFSTPPIPTGSSREVKWGVSSTGITMSGTPMLLTMSFPPPPAVSPTKKCEDTLTFCIRYRFTDTSCRTCDTLICYTVVRRAKLVIGVPVDNVQIGVKRETVKDDDDIDGTEKRPGRSVQAAGDEDMIASIAMSSSTDGKLTLKIPQVAGSEPGDAVTVVGLTFEPMIGVNLVSMKDDATGASATIVDHVARLPLTLAQGVERTFTLKYDNFTNQLVFSNMLQLRYVYASDPTDTLAGVLVVNARTPGAQGGDTIVRDISVGEQRKDVRTYALLFTSNNVSSDSIATVVIRTSGGTHILAVGPGRDSMSAVLHPFQSDAGSLYLSMSEGGDASAVAKGTSVGPIYITVSGAATDTTTFDYETRNGNGDVVSRGEVKVSNPITSNVPKDGDPSRTTTVSLADCFPNPLTGMTTIRFHLATAEPTVWLTVSDVTGRILARLIDGDRMESGAHETAFDASMLPSGTYYYTLRTPSGTQTRSMTVVR